MMWGLFGVFALYVISCVIVYRIGYKKGWHRGKEEYLEEQEKILTEFVDSIIDVNKHPNTVFKLRKKAKTFMLKRSGT
jgi:hypothetical protein